MGFSLSVPLPGLRVAWTASETHGRVCVVRTLLGLDVSVHSKAQSPSSMI